MQTLQLDDRMASILENSFDGIYITDGDANTILVNKSYETITGLKRTEMLNHNMRDLVERKVISASGTLMVLNSGMPVTLQQEFKTGKRALITSSPVFDEQHRIVMVVTNVRDLTEIYNLQVELKKSNKQQSLLQKELEHMKQQFMKQEIVANDAKTLETLRLADKVKKLDTTVMLLGESGVGKEVFAKYIHQGSARNEHPFIQVNCAAIPENLLESELFGYERGAFTGADRNGKAGLFEVADHGTIFLDEIGELPLSMQVKLLRVLQEQEIQRIGGVKAIPIDVRILAATNRNLEEMVQKETFRQDLYYRLMVFPIRIPPLRERMEDIPELLELFLSRLNQKYRSQKTFSPSSIQILSEYHWPGNIREVKNVVERAFIVSAEDIIHPDCLPMVGHRELPQPETAEQSLPVGNLQAYLEEIEQRCIREAYEKFGNVRAAAASLGMSAATFTRKKNR